MSWQFTVGLRVKSKADRIVVDAEDALIAAAPSVDCIALAEWIRK
jgi:hypothetical protein